MVANDGKKSYKEDIPEKEDKNYGNVKRKKHFFLLLPASVLERNLYENVGQIVGYDVGTVKREQKNDLHRIFRTKQNSTTITK